MLTGSITTSGPRSLPLAAPPYTRALFPKQSGQDEEGRRREEGRKEERKKGRKGKKDKREEKSIQDLTRLGPEAWRMTGSARTCADRFNISKTVYPKRGCRGRMAPDWSLTRPLANLSDSHFHMCFTRFFAHFQKISCSKIILISRWFQRLQNHWKMVAKRRLRESKMAPRGAQLASLGALGRPFCGLLVLSWAFLFAFWWQSCNS